MRPFALAFLGLALATPVAAQSHPCAADAAKKALALLRLHSESDDRAEVDARSIRTIGTVKALRGKGSFDVLAVQGSVYKADYRIRMIYAQIPGSCALMGQEIIESSDPY